MIGDDLRYALRTLARNPGFAFVSILALALCIGANSAIFTVGELGAARADALLQAKQLVVVRERNLERVPEFSLSPGNYLTYRDENHSFTGIAAIAGGNVNYAGAQEPERLRAARVTSNFSDLLHAAADAGPGLHQRGKRAGRRSRSDPQLRLVAAPLRRTQRTVGERINLNGEMYAVVGVMPKDFDFPSRNELWRPLTMEHKEWQQRGGHYLSGIGRLKPGVTLDPPAPTSTPSHARLQAAYPDSNHGPGSTPHRPAGRSGGQGPADDAHSAGRGSGFVLSSRAWNLANLLLSRSASRRKEDRHPGSAGRGKARADPPASTESLVLSAFGTALRAGVRVGRERDLLTNVDPSILPRATEISLDLRAGAGHRRHRRPDGPPLWSRSRPTNGARRLELVVARRRTRQLHGIPAQRRAQRAGDRRSGARTGAVFGAGLLMRSFYRLESVDTASTRMAC